MIQYEISKVLPSPLEPASLAYLLSRLMSCTLESRRVRALHSAHLQPLGTFEDIAGLSLVGYLTEVE
jgi:hypothetical protein